MSSCFVHFGAIHLVMNMLALASMGALAELLWGRWRMLAIYVLSGLGGSCLAMAIYPIDAATGATPVLAGASGAICGVLLALLTWMVLYRDYILRPVSDELMRRLGFALLLTIGISVFRGVSWQGHLGGAVVGFVTAVLLNAMRFGGRVQKWAGAVGLACVPVVCVGGLFAAMDSNNGWAQLRAWHSGEKLADVVAKPVRPTADAEARLKAAQAALDDYEKNVKPLLDKLSPAAVAPVEAEAEIVLIRSIRKKPESAAAVRAKVERLRAVAADASKRLSVPPIAVDVIDTLRAKSLAFAAARLKSFDLLLGLLAADAPDPKAEEAWNAAHTEAHRLWFEIASK
jgi:hypothetical protein